MKDLCKVLAKVINNTGIFVFGALFGALCTGIASFYVVLTNINEISKKERPVRSYREYYREKDKEKS